MIVVTCQISNFSAKAWREQVNFQRDDEEEVALKKTNTISQRIDMLLHSDTLS